MKNKLAIFLLILSSQAFLAGEKTYAVINPSLTKNSMQFHPSKNKFKVKTIPREILIKFKSNSLLIKNQFSLKNKQHKIKNIFTLSGQKNIKEKNISKWHKISLPPNTTLEELSEIYKNCPEIELVEPNHIYDICSSPNDPYYNSSTSWGQSYRDMWGLHKIGLSHAWEIEKGNASIIVAVVDTGIDHTHPDITHNIWHNSGEIPDNGIDDDHNGYIDDTIGWNFTNNSNDPKDGQGHGSHIAGTIAGITNNATGISGISWNSQIMSVKGISDNGWGTAADLANSIKYAADNGANIINLSWGGIGTSWIIKEALDYAYSKGCIIVAAAGNSNQDVNTFFPANYEKAITVAATNFLDEKTFFSNYGTKIDVAAPGMDILSLKAEGTVTSGVVGTNYCRLSGTSMSAPHVCGIAALILSRHPDYTNEKIATLITCSADDLGEEGKDIYFGWGRINAYKALLASDGIFITDRDLTVIDTPGDKGKSITISWPKNSYSEIEGYKIYYSLTSFTDLSQATYYPSSPLNNPQATSAIITNLGSESCGYYFSVIGNIDRETMSTDLNLTTSFSTTEATYPVNNTINTLTDNEVIIAGFDPQTKVVIPQGTSNNEKTLDIFKPNTSELPNQEGEEFSSLNDQSDELLSTIREI
ncbi:S8 family serine peptidase, partial [bacterium]|nr:S8 family serine peptidase [bacterium]